MKQKLEALTSARTKLADLLAQCSRIEEMEEKNRTEAGSLRDRLNDAEAAHRNCERRHIRGQTSADGLSAAKALMDDLRGRLTEGERMAGLAQDALSEMQTEISGAQNQVLSAFAAYCNSVKADISKALNSDKKIRAQLLEAYAAMATAGTGYNGTWHLFLAGIFEQPTQTEIATAAAEFKPKHRLV